MSTTVADLVAAHGRVKVLEVSEALGLSRKDAAKAMHDAAAAQPDESLLYIVTAETPAGTRVVACIGRREEQKALEAFGQRTVSLHAVGAVTAPGRPTAGAFRPRVPPLLRNYPLATRESLETHTPAGDAAPTPPSIPVAVKRDTPPAEVMKPVEAQVCCAIQQESLHVESNSEEQVHAPSRQSPPQAPLDSVPTHAESVTAAESAAVTTAAEGLASPPKQRLSVFDMMKESAKRPRVPPIQRQSGDPRPQAKKAKVDSTTSLAKLAKAAAKKTVGQPIHRAPRQNVLDEEPEEEEPTVSRESSLFSRQASVCETQEGPMLDVDVSEANDDIIICDDAPPIAFLAPLSRQPPAPPHTTRNPRSTCTSQPPLGVFFSSDVLKFQRSFQREIRTDSKVVDGEYLCCERVYYRSTTTNELITEDEFRRRSAETAARSASTHPTPPRDAGTGDMSPCTPAAGAKKPSVAKQAKKETPKSKGLLAYMK